MTVWWHENAYILTHVDANTMETYKHTGDKAMNMWDKLHSFWVIYSVDYKAFISWINIHFHFPLFFLSLFLFLIKIPHHLVVKYIVSKFF